MKNENLNLRQSEKVLGLRLPPSPYCPFAPLYGAKPRAAFLLEKI